LNNIQTNWLQKRYKCVHCFSNVHTLDQCRAAGRKWTITSLSLAPGAVPAGGRPPSGRLAEAPSETTDQEPPPRPLQPTPTRTKASRVTSPSPGEDDETESEADELDDVFTHLGYDSDPKFLLALSQAADRSAADARRMRFIDDPPPNTTTTVAKIGKKECKWADPAVTRTAVGLSKTRWSDDEPRDLAKLASTLPVYNARLGSSHQATSSHPYSYHLPRLRRHQHYGSAQGHVFGIHRPPGPGFGRPAR
jgi:hypothetical protein